MRKFDDYNEVKENNFDREKLELGGHICKIKNAYVKEFQGKETPEKFEFLYIEFDIAAPDEQEGFYQRKFAEDARKDATNAKWKGIYKLSVPKSDGSENDDRSKVTFKTFITSVEKSNSGYDWQKSNWDEKTLVGKKFGGVFGIKEFENLTGEIAYNVECRFIRSVDAIQEEWKKIEAGEEIKKPKVKRADKTLMEYDEWIAERKAAREAEKNNTNSFGNSNPDIKPIEDDSDLPF